MKFNASDPLGLSMLAVATICITYYMCSIKHTITMYRCYSLIYNPRGKYVKKRETIWGRGPKKTPKQALI